ncbi:hypothetical protein FB451DRAFT_1566997 [Mycena latifolia]|nr:hypothetical protein FB451DRAFT_1566997 [Mycena latifolia]
MVLEDPMISGDVTSSATPIVRSSSVPLTGAGTQVVHAEVLDGGYASSWPPEGHGYFRSLVNQTFPEYPFKAQGSVKSAALALGFDMGHLHAPNVPVGAFWTPNYFVEIAWSFQSDIWTIG